MFHNYKCHHSPGIVISDKITIKNNNIRTVFQIRSHSPVFFFIFRKKININHIITNDLSVFYKHLKIKTCFINQEIQLNSTILYMILQIKLV